MTNSMRAMCPFCGQDVPGTIANKYQLVDNYSESEEFFNCVRYAIVRLTFSEFGTLALWLHLTPLSLDNVAIDDTSTVIVMDNADYAVVYRNHPMILDNLLMATTVLTELSRVLPNDIHNIVSAKPVEYNGVIPHHLKPIASLNHWKTQLSVMPVHDMWLHDNVNLALWRWWNCL